MNRNDSNKIPAQQNNINIIKLDLLILNSVFIRNLQILQRIKL